MKKYISAALFGAILLTSCQQNKIHVKEITCDQIIIDSTLDRSADPQLQAFVDSYKQQIDSVMNVRIGTASQTLASGKPQSLLANLTADILVQAGSEYTGKPVQFAVMNNGGLRAPINAGAITVGDIFKVFPFENELVVLELKGIQVKELFKRLAAIGGEGLSGCQFEIKNNQIASLLIGGKPVDDEQVYWMATIDYLADGNSGMSVLEQAHERINTGIRLRDVMIEYVQRLTAQGKEVNSAFDNRINVLP
ncbi:MAG: 5'-nucleotidase C-terminal domain-containing protein [Bacteroidales bacterium]